MRFVERADIRPHRCAAIPFIGASHPRGFIDTGSELEGFDNHVYFSVQAVEEACKVLGWPTVQQHADAVADLERALARVTELEADLEEANRTLNAIDALESADFRARKKAGRPKKEVDA